MVDIARLRLGPWVAAPRLCIESSNRLPGTLPCVCGAGERFYATGVIGRGGHGVIVRYASTTDPSRAVALKVVRGGRAAAEEDEGCEVPECPGVVSQRRLLSLDPGAPGFAFFVMQCLEHDIHGLPPATGAGAVARARGVVAAVAATLAGLAKVGRRYHDVKPANVLVDAAGGFHLADISSVACRSSTYPPPNCLRRVHPWYRHNGGFMQGPRAECYALNTVWTLMVCFLIVALPGRRVVCQGAEMSLSSLFVYSNPAVRQKNTDATLRAAEHLLGEIDAPVARHLGGLLRRVRSGHLPELARTLATLKDLRSSSRRASAARTPGSA